MYSRAHCLCILGLTAYLVSGSLPVFIALLSLQNKSILASFTPLMLLLLEYRTTVNLSKHLKATDAASM